MKTSKFPVTLMALIIGFLGLLSSFYYYFFGTIGPDESNILQDVIFWISPYAGVWIYGMDIFNISNDMTLTSINIMSIIVFTMFLIGALLYYYSQGKRSNLLQICFSIILITSGISMITGPLNFIIIKLTDNPNMGFISGNNWSWILFLIKNIIFTFVSFKIIKQISEEKENKKISPNAKEPVGKGSRFVHYFIDLMICFFYLSSAINNSFIFRNLFDLDYKFSELSMQISFYFSFILYYIFFEATFHTSPGKMATGSKIIAEKGSLTFGKVLGRTFSRFVPFEPLSFFGDKGWHDKWTDTQVVKEGSKATEEHKISYEELGLIDA